MHKDFPASIVCLHDMLSTIRSVALNCGFTPEILQKIELASEEALVNIIKHGFLNKAGTINIYCEPFENKGIRIIILDDGISFNPLAYHEHFPCSNEEFGVGGWGIMIILNAMDHVEYKRENNMNCLTLVKFFSMENSIK